MEIVCKVLDNKGNVRFKCDTFWTLSGNIIHAKIHNLEALLPDGHLVGNYLSSFGGLNEHKEKNKYHGFKIGYDIVLEKDGYNILKTKQGEWIYKIKYIKDEDKLIVVDASRLAKLKNIEKSCK